MEKRGLTAQLLEVGCGEGAGVYWGDEMRLGLMGQVRKVWAPRGVKVVQPVEYKREWTYLNLAVNGLRGELRWAWTQDMKGKSIAPVVQQWGTSGVSVVVWDRARGHRGRAYDEVKVQRVEQPPYSPELNPAERVFEYLRAEVEGEVYGTLEVKQQAVETVLRKLAATPERVKSLAGWEWIRHSINRLSSPNTVFH